MNGVLNPKTSLFGSNIPLYSPRISLSIPLQQKKESKKTQKKTAFGPLDPQGNSNPQRQSPGHNMLGIYWGYIGMMENMETTGSIGLL